MRQLITVLFLLMSNLLCFAQNGGKVESIDLYYLPLDLKTRVRVTPETIKTMEVTKHLQLDSIEGLSDKVEKLKPKKKYSNIDVRIYCAINYENGSVDQLSFDVRKLIMYNDTVYRKNRRLFREIRSKLSNRP